MTGLNVLAIFLSYQKWAPDTNQANQSPSLEFLNLNQEDWLSFTSSPLLSPTLKKK